MGKKVESTNNEKPSSNAGFIYGSSFNFTLLKIPA